MTDVHVTPDGEDGWKVTVENTTVSTHRTQDEAVKAGRDEADRRSSELVIHGRDGKIRAKDSEGNDPREIPG